MAETKVNFTEFVQGEPFLRMTLWVYVTSFLGASAGGAYRLAYRNLGTGLQAASETHSRLPEPFSEISTAATNAILMAPSVVAASAGAVLTYCTVKAMQNIVAASQDEIELLKQPYPEIVKHKSPGLIDRLKSRPHDPLDQIDSRLAGGPRPTPRPGSTRSSHLEMLAMIDGERARRSDGSTAEDVLNEVLRYKRPEVAGRIVEQVYSNALELDQNGIENPIQEQPSTV